MPEREKWNDTGIKSERHWPAAESVGLTYQYIDTESNSAEELTSFDQMVIEYYKIRYHLQWFHITQNNIPVFWRF